jgi:hypothetical protein
MWVYMEDGLQAVNTDRLESMQAKSDGGDTFMVTASDWYANQHVLRTGFETLSDAKSWLNLVLLRANAGNNPVVES